MVPFVLVFEGKIQFVAPLNDRPVCFPQNIGKLRPHVASGFRVINIVPSEYGITYRIGGSSRCLSAGGVASDAVEHTEQPCVGLDKN
jgi:hypothetical protein